MSIKSQRIAARNVKNALKKAAHQRGMTNFRKAFTPRGVVHYQARQGAWIRTFWVDGKGAGWY